MASAAVAWAVVKQLGKKNLRASVRMLPAWPSRTPDTGVAIVLDVNGEMRPLALAETWKLRAHLPPGSRAGRLWQWGSEAFPLGAPMCIPDRAIADGLAEMVEGWSTHPGDVATLDVVFTLLETLPPAKGGWCALVDDAAAWIGVERGDRRWPTFVSIDARGDHVVIDHAAAPPSADRHWDVRTRGDLDEARAEIAACVAKLYAWCEKFVEDRRALERFADVLCVELGKTHIPRHGEHWHVSTGVDSFDVRDRPSASIGQTTRIFEDDAGRVVVDGVTYAKDAPLGVLVEAVHATALRALPLRDGERYRLKRPLKGLMTGEVVTFLSAQDIRPNDTLLYSFDRLALQEATEDAVVMSAMPDWFTWVEDELDPAKARVWRARSLALVGRHLREHGELDAAESRVREAMALGERGDPDYTLALEEARLIAAARET